MCSTGISYVVYKEQYCLSNTQFHHPLHIFPPNTGFIQYEQHFIYGDNSICGKLHKKLTLVTAIATEIDPQPLDMSEAIGNKLIKVYGVFFVDLLKINRTSYTYVENGHKQIQAI